MGDRKLPMHEVHVMVYLVPEAGEPITDDEMAAYSDQIEEAVGDVDWEGLVRQRLIDHGISMKRVQVVDLQF